MDLLVFLTAQRIVRSFQFLEELAIKIQNTKETE